MQLPAKTTGTPEDPSAISAETEELRLQILDYLKEYKPRTPSERKDVLEGHYLIHFDQPLPELDTAHAKAYKVTDEEELDRPLYALLCNKEIPVRLRALRAMKSVAHPNLIQIAAFGTVECSKPAEQRFIIIYERPKGKKLSALIAEQQRRLPDSFLLEQILMPLASALYCFEEKGYAHGRLNPNNIYFGDTLTLGEYASEPCGMSQDFRFEPINRLQAVPAGRGEGSVEQDYYALGVLAAWLKFGSGMFAHSPDPTSHLQLLLKDGTYNALVGNRDLSDSMSDLLRGTLNDNAHERWKYQHIKPWTTGRRYNLLPPSIGSVGSRAFTFEGVEYTNFRNLAEGLYRRWDTATSVLRDGSLSRWAELSARRKDTAEVLTRAVKSLGGEMGRGDRQNSELIARCLTILDPSAPLRMKEVSTHVDGISTLFAEYFRDGAEQSLQHLADIIEQGLPNVWGELQRRDVDESLPPDVSTAVWNVERVRLLLRSPGYGFGAERCLYELNPDLPCLSPMLSGFYVTTLQQLLTALDQLALTKARQEEPLDRHIAAFIANRVGLMQEATPKEFKHVPALLKSKSLIALKLLQLAEQKAGHPKLPGLSSWMAASVAQVLDHYSSKTLRKQVSKALRQMGYGGYVTPIAELMYNIDYIAADINGFETATYQYYALTEEMEKLQDENMRVRSANDLGHSLARVISYTVFVTVLLFVTKGYLF